MTKDNTVDQDLSGEKESDGINSDIQNTPGGTIIIMDDDECIRDSLSGMLMALGYDVIHMDDGTGVIDFLDQKHEGAEFISAIILDLVIPGGMGGKDTAAAVRKRDSSIPVFAISGYNDDPIMARPEDYGFTASLGKPFLIKDLSDMLSNYI